MGMTIDEHIAQLVRVKHYAAPRHYETLDTAIDTMRKYQKIQELIEYHMLRFLSKERMSGFQKDILEVVDNGNDDC